jgi:hypothetical protein
VALLTAKRPELQPLIDHLHEVAQGRDDIRTGCAGIISGSWFVNPAERGEELIAVGLLMLAGPVDFDELDKWAGVHAATICLWLGYLCRQATAHEERLNADRRQGGRSRQTVHGHSPNFSLRPGVRDDVWRTAGD